MRRHIGIYKRFILDHRCAVSMFGRVRPLPEVESEDPILSSKALRAGYNHLVQATASDMLLTGLWVIDQAMFDAGLESKPVNTVYDSVAIDTRRDELERVCTIADEVLNNLPEVLELALGEEFNSDWTRVVPLSADGEVGLNYLDQMKLDSFKDASGQIDWDKALAKLAGTIAA
jgi:DNA polymerase I-like protein with 3'-5' exonuclease and polymerase domains